jgi:hypothetical protein
MLGLSQDCSGIVLPPLLRISGDRGANPQGLARARWT